MPILPRLFFVFITGSGLALNDAAAAAAPALPDFGGIWRLNDQQSDSPHQIAARRRAERKREEADAHSKADCWFKRSDDRLDI